MDFDVVKVNAVAWLTDKRWIVFSFYGDFPSLLEDLYFTPGTPKNDEFEVMVAPVINEGVNGIAPFFRVKDTAENRDLLRAAFAEFYGSEIITLAKLDLGIEKYRRQIKELILPKLR